MSNIDDKGLSHLFSLARIEEEKDKEKREKLLKDLEKILDYFSQLKEIDTENVEPMAGGTFLESVFREDSERNEMTDEERDEQREIIIDDFPEDENKKLKVPPVFN